MKKIDPEEETVPSRFHYYGNKYEKARGTKKIREHVLKSGEIDKIPGELESPSKTGRVGRSALTQGESRKAMSEGEYPAQSNWY